MKIHCSQVIGHAIFSSFYHHYSASCSHQFKPVYLVCVRSLFLTIVLCVFCISGGFQSTICHEESFARPSYCPDREEEPWPERGPVDSRTGPPGASVKH